jgi:N-acetylmuramoyl-L-alanine amidase
MQNLRHGDRGRAVAQIRSMLASIGLLNNTDISFADCFDGPTELAVRHFQQRRGISVDGRVGPETYAALTEAHWRLGDRPLAHQAGQPLIGDDVADLQRQLLELGYDIKRADGIFGRTTAEALRAFQHDYGLVPDGICGPGTLRALRQLGRRVVGGRPQLLRELVAVADSGPSLLGGRLAALGVQSWLTRGPHNSRSDVERAEFANDAGADLVLSLHVDGFASPRPHGLAAYYYGAGEASSTIGERLADLVQRELVARTAMHDNRIHGKTWAILRLTRMPAVRVELGYLTSAIDRPMLRDPLFRDTVAEGLLVAVQRLYLPTADDPPTGVLRIPAVAS